MRCATSFKSLMKVYIYLCGAIWLSDGYDKVDTMGGQSSSAFKNQIVGLLQAVKYLKGRTYSVLQLNLALKTLLFSMHSDDNFLPSAVPLIAINLLVIIIEMIAGG
jgi:hypothetical protein